MTAVLDFLLLLAVLRLVAWPLLDRQRLSAPAPQESDVDIVGAPVSADLDDSIERAIASRKAALSGRGCLHCGQSIGDGDVFCRRCGTHLPVPVSTSDGEPR
jgi:hypothetical protein